MQWVVGADVWSKGWVAVALEPARTRWARSFPSFADLLEAARDATVIGVDIPIVLPEAGARACDVAARQLAGPRWQSVFITPPRAVIAAPSYAAARKISYDRFDRGVSAQTYALATRILEVEPHAATDGRIHEIHPELAFAAIAGAPMADPKRTWNGQTARRTALESAGITLPGSIDQPVPPDDVLDAAAVAWSAMRILDGSAERIPAEGAGPAIWR